MPFFYRLKTTLGNHDLRMQIPRSTRELVHGEKFDKEVIDQLNASQKQNVKDRIEFLKTQNPPAETASVVMVDVETGKETPVELD